jgi:outer membrane protein assembly factor BamD (BamD/ComL family)
VINDEEEEVGRHTWNRYKSNLTIKVLQAVAGLEDMEIAAGKKEGKEIDIAAVLDLAETCILIEQYDKAIAVLGGISENEKLSKDEKLQVKSCYLIGKARLYKGSFKDAREAFEEVCKIDAEGLLGYKFTLQYEYGSALLQLKEYEEARTAFNLFIEKNGKHEDVPVAFFNTAFTYYYEGNKAEAVKTWEEFAKKFPEHALAKTATAYTGQVTRMIEQEKAAADKKADEKETGEEQEDGEKKNTEKDASDKRK